MNGNPTEQPPAEPYRGGSDESLERRLTPQASSLPKQVAAAAAEAEQIERWILTSRPNRGGRPRAPVKHNVFTGNTLEDLDATVFAHTKAIGKKTRGNRRLGEVEFYADLVKSVMEMRRAGILPPKGGSLSRWACDPQFGLGEILRKHKKISEKQMKALETSSEIRLEIGKKMSRQFTRVSDSLSE
jgi:hypothetical protein